MSAPQQITADVSARRGRRGLVVMRLAGLLFLFFAGLQTAYAGLNITPVTWNAELWHWK